MPHGHCDSGIWGRISWGALALFLVIAGGTAYAANTIGSADIINGQVKSVDIGDNQVQSADVRDDTLPNGGLTGADVRENTLSVPTAGIAETQFSSDAGCHRPGGLGAEAEFRDDAHRGRHDPAR